jgi:hypothetical protein
MKRSLLLSKVRKSSDKKTAAPRRRRPSRKLAASLNALAATLPDMPTAPPATKSGGPSKPATGAGMSESLERKRGLTKRREKLVKAETERFGKNLAILALAGAKAATCEGEEGGGMEDEASAGLEGYQARSEGGALSGPGGGQPFRALREHLMRTVGRP